MTFKEEMIKLHTHAEIVYDEYPDAIVYREDDVIKLLTMVRDKTLEWAADNAETQHLGNNFVIVDQQSILNGKSSQSLEI